MINIHANRQGRSALDFPLSLFERGLLLSCMVLASIALPFGFAVALYAATPEPLRPVLFWWLEALA